MIYFAIGLSTVTWYKFPVFIVNYILIYNSFGAFGYVLGASISNAEVVGILTPVLIVPLMLFAGFFVN